MKLPLLACVSRTLFAETMADDACRGDMRAAGAVMGRRVGDTAPGGKGTAAADVFAGGGMGALMRATDWSQTALGPVEAWPQSLRTMVGVVLGSRFPMLLWWGPDLLHFYNDSYRPMLTDKHPASLGAPGAQVWAEIWDVVGPMARGVQDGGPATWSEDLQLFISTGGIAEARYFTFSYSPVPGEDGGIGGVLGTVQETTAKVQSERQIRSRISQSGGSASSWAEWPTWKRAASSAIGFAAPPQCSSWRRRWGWRASGCSPWCTPASARVAPA